MAKNLWTHARADIKSCEYLIKNEMKNEEPANNGSNCDNVNGKELFSISLPRALSSFAPPLSRGSISTVRYCSSLRRASFPSWLNVFLFNFTQQIMCAIKQVKRIVRAARLPRRKLHQQLTTCSRNLTNGNRRKWRRRRLWQCGYVLLKFIAFWLRCDFSWSV